MLQGAAGNPVDDTPNKPLAHPVPIAAMDIDPKTPLFRVRSFALLFTTRVASTTAVQMLAVVVGWHVYELTDSALHLGLIGLVQFLPPVMLMLIAGPVADRFNRRIILRWCYAVAFTSSAGLVVIALTAQPYLPAIYGLLFINSVARIFEQPVMQALVPVMVPRVILTRAIAAHVSARQLSVLLGPSLGGILYVFGAGVRLQHRGRAVSRRRGRQLHAARPAGCGGAAQDELGNGLGRLPLHLELQARARRDAARPGFEFARRRQRAAPYLCARYPADWRLGRRRAAQRAGTGRAVRRRRRSRAFRFAAAAGFGCCRLHALRPGDDRLRRFRPTW